MKREICVYLEFLEERHRRAIRETAEELGFTVQFFTPAEFDEARDCLQHCEILYAAAPELLRSAPEGLQWYACAFAGVDPYCRNDGIFRNPDCLLTNANVYDVTIAEHVVMVLLMLLRRMPEYERIVEQREWKHDLPIRSIRGGEFTILGSGSIGTRIAESLKGLGAKRVIGLSRSGKGRSAAFDEVLPATKLDEILPNTQALILALPSTPETVGILSRERIALLPESALLINIGRGSALDQEALMDALREGRLKGAAIDVMEPEPLPKEHPLWEAPNLILTPHISGNLSLAYTRNENVALFCRNLRHYAAGEALESLVDRSRGY